MFFLQVAGDIRDIKGPVYFPVNYLPVIILICALVFALLYFLIRYVLRKSRERKARRAAAAKPPHVAAYEALDLLKAKNLPAKGLFKEYYFELSLIVRRYIESRFNIKAPEMTTEEFLSTLKDSNVLTDTHKGLLKEFLTLCDIVKFARYGPSEGETNESFMAAKRFVDETKVEEERPVK